MCEKGWKGEGWAEREKERGELIEYKGGKREGVMWKGNSKNGKGGVLKWMGKKGGLLEQP